jgi:hypothetical protein
MAFFDWDGGDFPFNKVFAHASPFKILLKTRDDPWFIRKWFDHHRAICGPENIVIFDNRSTDPSVLDFYRDISATTQIVRFRFHMDHLHHTDMQPGLYRALAQSCRRFCFLDTDEFLACLADDRTLMRPEDIVSLAPAFHDDGPDYWPGLWLHNAFKSENTFHLGGQRDLCTNIQWGKPVLSAAKTPSGMINHNIQVAALTGNVASTSPFLILHAKNLLPEQRIAATMKKLATYNYVDAQTRPEEVATMDLSRGQFGTPDLWVGEIAQMLKARNDPEGIGAIRIDGNAITVRDDRSMASLASLYRDARAACAECGLLPGAA